MGKHVSLRKWLSLIITDPKSHHTKIWTTTERSFLCSVVHKTESHETKILTSNLKSSSSKNNARDFDVKVRDMLSRKTITKKLEIKVF